MSFFVPRWLYTLWRHKRETSLELLSLIAFGLMPIWLGSVIAYVKAEGVGQFLYSYLKNGEALLISAATIGPLFYILLKDYEKRSDGFSRSFPGNKILGLLIVLICLVSASIFGVIGTNIETKAKNLAALSGDALVAVSVIITLVSAIVWIAIVTIKNALEHGAGGVMRQDTNSFLQEWKNG